MSTSRGVVGHVWRAGADLGLGVSDPGWNQPIRRCLRTLAQPRAEAAGRWHQSDQIPCHRLAGLREHGRGVGPGGARSSRMDHDGAS